MTEENHCYENSVAERINGILKDEFLLDTTFRNKTMADKACKQAIETYNKLRLHMSLNFKTPNQVHLNVA
ncbi:MAG: transposase [Candidatus Delongbacteria bacterium]|nr:MAG: transposase [Candidatus Delongbacteria bacterium]